MVMMMVVISCSHAHYALECKTNIKQAGEKKLWLFYAYQKITCSLTLNCSLYAPFNQVNRWLLLRFGWWSSFKSFLYQFDPFFTWWKPIFFSGTPVISKFQRLNRSTDLPNPITEFLSFPHWTFFLLQVLVLLFLLSEVITFLF